MHTKEHIEELLKSSNTNNLDIFKNKKDTDFSLTPHGYMLLCNAKLYSKTYTAKFEKEQIQSTSVLISLKKIFDCPYFIKGSKVYYFDDIVHTQICIHGSLYAYIIHLKGVDKFNSAKK
jgi:hypothetical protein